MWELDLVDSFIVRHIEIPSFWWPDGNQMHLISKVSCKHVIGRPEALPFLKVNAVHHTTHGQLMLFCTIFGIPEPDIVVTAWCSDSGSISAESKIKTFLIWVSTDAVVYISGRLIIRHHLGKADLTLNSKGLLTKGVYHLSGRCWPFPRILKLYIFATRSIPKVTATESREFYCFSIPLHIARLNLSLDQVAFLFLKSGIHATRSNCRLLESALSPEYLWCWLNWWFYFFNRWNLSLFWFFSTRSSNVSVVNEARSISLVNSDLKVFKESFILVLATGSDCTLFTLTIFMLFLY